MNMLLQLRRYRAGLALLVLAALAFLYLPRRTDEQLQIRNMLADWQAALAKSAAEPPAMQIGASRRLGQFFADSFVVSGDVRELAGNYDRQSAVAMAMQARSQFEKIELSLSRIEIELQSERDAMVSAQAVLRLRGVGGATETLRRQLHLVVGKNVDGRWEVRVAQALALP